MKTPKLRFKDDINNSFPEWDKFKASDLFSSLSNKNHNGEFPVLSATQDQGIVLRDSLERRMDFSEENLKSYKLINKNDFVISLRSFQGGIEHSNVKGLVSPAYTVFRKSSSKVFEPYFSKFFKSTSFIKRLNKATYGIRDGKSISYKDFSTLDLYLPCYEEQVKIWSFINLLDRKIQLQEQKIDSLIKQKKGYMQKIFNREYRFKNIDGEAYPEWEYIKLGKLTRKTGAKNKAGIKLPIAAISNKKGFMLEGNRNYSKVDVDIKNYKIVNRNEFAYNPARINVGSFGFQNVSEVVIVSSLYVIFQTLDKLSNAFLKTYMHSSHFNKDVIRNTEGSVRDYLFYENFSNIIIPLPCPEEQEKIANLLLKLEDKIQLEEQRLNYLQQQRKWFMQQMFI